MIRWWILPAILGCFFVNGKILRNGRHQFYGDFTIVEGSSRLMSNCVRNITENLSEGQCTTQCLLEPSCKSFNRHKTKGFCELLSISKFDVLGSLERDLNWIHYETDEDATEIGMVCQNLNKCQPYEVCEDTFQAHPAYRCKCRDGFEGERCKNYTGPGTTDGNRATSCYHLFERSKFIPDDNYWLKDQKNKVQCTRKVEFTQWSSYSSCLCSNQTRHRRCANPEDERKLKQCKDKRLILETRACDGGTCQLITEPMALPIKKTLATVSELSMDYEVNFYFKPEKGKTFGPSYHQIFGMWRTDDGCDEAYCHRQPAVFFKPVAQVATIGFRATVSNKNNYVIDIRRPISIFDDWVKITILQNRQPGPGQSFMYRVGINDQIVKEVINTHPMVFRNLTVFQTGKSYPRLLSGEIRNLSIKGASGIKLL